MGWGERRLYMLTVHKAFGIHYQNLYSVVIVHYGGSP